MCCTMGNLFMTSSSYMRSRPALARAQDGSEATECSMAECSWNGPALVAQHKGDGAEVEEVVRLLSDGRLRQHALGLSSGWSISCAEPSRKGRNWKSSRPQLPLLPAGSSQYVSWMFSISWM